jgi:hypothetical protein
MVPKLQDIDCKTNKLHSILERVAAASTCADHAWVSRAAWSTLL